MRRRAATLAIAALAAFGPRAEAAVFVNGVVVDGQPLNVKLDRCAVTFDGKGNVLISAPGYQVQALPAPGAEAVPASPAVVASAAPPAQALSRKYFVVSEQTQPGQTQYDIDLYVNARWVRKFHSDDEQVVADISQYLRPGANKVMFVAKKNLSVGRKSQSADATYRITLGEGDENEDKVVIDNPLLSFQRSADQADDTSQEFVVQGR